MTAAQFGNHAADHVVQIQPCLDIRQQNRVLLLDGIPVASVHVFHIIAVAEGAPDLIKNLRPFLGIVHRRIHVRDIDLLSAADFGGREVHRLPDRSGEQGLLVARAVHDHRLGAFIALAGRKVKNMSSALSGVPEFLAVAEIIARVADRQLDDPLRQSFEIDSDLSRFGLFRFFLCGGILVRLRIRFRILGLRRRVAVGRQKRRRRVRSQHRHISPAHVGVGIVPLDPAVDRIQIPVGGKDEILSLRAEGRRAGIVPPVRHGIFLAGGEVAQINDVHLILGRLRIGQPLAVPGDVHGTEFRFRALRNGFLRLGDRIHLDDAVLPVRVIDVLAVGAP